MKNLWKFVLPASLIVIFIISGFLNIYDFTQGQEVEHKNIIEKAESKKKTTNKKKLENKFILELTEKSIDIEVGSEFNYLNYIETARNNYGYNVQDEVTVNQKLNTNEIGIHQIDYVLKINDSKAITKSLIVNVIEY